MSGGDCSSREILILEYINPDNYKTTSKVPSISRNLTSDLIQRLPLSTKSTVSSLHCFARRSHFCCRLTQTFLSCAQSHPASREPNQYSLEAPGRTSIQVLICHHDTSPSTSCYWSITRSPWHKAAEIAKNIPLHYDLRRDFRANLPPVRRGAKQRRLNTTSARLENTQP